jgi:golgi phosphoprotein 3
MLGFAEEIVLLQLDETTPHGFADLPVAALDVAVAGAVLMELALNNRVDADLERLFVVDPSASGDAILDDAVARLKAAGGELDHRAAIECVTVNAGQYRQEALKRLVAKGILREENGRFLWVFHTRRYPVIDDREQREVRTRLRQVLLTDEIPDPRDVVLISLIEACDLLGLVLSAAEAEAARARVEQLGRLDLIGQAMVSAVGEIRLLVRNAAAAVF